MEHRLALTQHLIDKTQLTLPVYVDDMNGAARKAFASFHLAAYVIDTYGKIRLLKRYKYTEPEIKTALDQVLQSSNEKK